MPHEPSTSPYRDVVSLDEPATRRGRRVALWVGVVALVASAAGALREVRRLDALERVAAFDAPPAALWTPGPDGRRRFLVGTPWRVPTHGVLRVRACAAGGADPDLSLELLDASREGRRVLETQRLSRERSTSKRCVEAAWRTETARPVHALLVAKGAPPSLPRLGVRVGGVIGARDLWPVALLVAGLALLVLSPRFTRGPGDAPAGELPPYGSLPAVVRGRVGPFFAVAMLLLVNVLAQVPVLLWGLRGATMFASMVSQQVALALASAAMLGALRRGGGREALELGVAPPGWALRAVAAASALLGLALLTGHFLKDAGDTPIGQVVESMPTRYVLAFGALCAPLPEELFFRGLLGRAFSRAGATAAVWASAAVFTAMHATQLRGEPLGLVPIAAVGLVNGYLRVRSRTLAVPWAVHTLYNAALALSAVA